MKVSSSGWPQTIMFVASPQFSNNNDEAYNTLNGLAASHSLYVLACLKAGFEASELSLNAAGFNPLFWTGHRCVLTTMSSLSGVWKRHSANMGLLRDINRVDYHVRELRIVDDRGQRITGFGTNVFVELTNGRYVTLARSDLSRLLFEKVKGTTEVIFDNEIVGLHEQADCVRVQFKHGGENQFDLVIGADGLHSDVRKLAFGPQEVGMPAHPRGSRSYG